MLVGVQRTEQSVGIIVGGGPQHHIIDNSPEKEERDREEGTEYI